MSNYTPEEVDMLIEMMKAKAPAKHRDILSKKPGNLSGKPFLNKTERTIKFLENRHKYFNPTREMLTYIIGIAENSNLDKSLIAKMKEDLLTKR